MSDQDVNLVDSSPAEDVQDAPSTPTVPVTNNEELMDTLTEEMNMQSDEATSEPSSEEEETSAKTDESEVPAKGKSHEKFIPYERFEEVNTRMKSSEESNITLQNKLSNLEGKFEQMQKSSPAQPAEAKPDFDDLSAKTDDQLRDMFEENPKEVLGNLARQVRHEVETDILGKLNQQAQQNKAKTSEQRQWDAINKYSDDNPGFVEKWNDGTLQNYMATRPGMTAMHAFTELQAEGNIKSASEKAVKEAEARWKKNIEAKKNLGSTLGSGPPSRMKSVAEDSTLQNTKTAGGTNAVLAQRWLKRIEELG